MNITELSIDIETRSSVDLNRCGVYKYAESPDFDILLFGVSVDRGPVRVYDLAGGEKLPYDILLALADSRVGKWAYNAAFERVCLSAWLRRNEPDLLYRYDENDEEVEADFLSPESWRCSMVLAAYSGLPLGLEQVGKSSASKRRK